MIQNQQKGENKYRAMNFIYRYFYDSLNQLYLMDYPDNTNELLLSKILYKLKFNCPKKGSTLIQ